MTTTAQQPVTPEQLSALAGSLKDRGLSIPSLRIAMRMIRLAPIKQAGYWAAARALTPSLILQAKRTVWRVVGGSVPVQALKRAIQRVLGATGLCASRWARQRNPGQVFFLFRNADIGGAERVHAQIVRAVSDRKPWVYFSERGVDDVFLGEYTDSGRIVRAGRLARGRWLGHIYAGFLAGIINRHESPVVLGCHSRLFYRVVPLLSRHVRCVDLRHAFEHGFEVFSSHYAQRLDARVVISQQHACLRGQLYATRGLGPDLLTRSIVIENGVALGSCESRLFSCPQVTVLFVARGAPEKRPHLVGAVASRCRSQGLRARFVIVGPTPDWIAPGDRDNCEFLGIVRDPQQMSQLYREAHLILLTSVFEGMPLVIQEAMAHGVVPIVTRCGALGEHLNGDNGIIVDNGAEDTIVMDMTRAVDRLASDRALLERMSRRAWEYARDHYTAPAFTHHWRRVLLGEPASNPGPLNSAVAVSPSP